MAKIARRNWLAVSVCYGERSRLGSTDRPGDGIIGHRRIEGFEADPDQPQTGSCRCSRRSVLGLGRYASSQRPAGQELVCTAHALDEHHAIVAIASSSIALQQPSTQRPVDHPAQHRPVVADVVQPARAGARSQTEISERPPQRDPHAPVADCGGEPAAVTAHLLEQITLRRSADLALDLLQVEQSLPSTGTVDDVAERLPHPLRTLRIVPGLRDIQPGQRAEAIDDPVRTGAYGRTS
jgi:hypothetical protein